MAFRAGYGTIAQDSPAPSDIDAERAAMLQTSSSKNTFVSRCTEHLTVNVTKSWGDVALLGCYLITGLLDSSSIMVWGSFVSMQTGKHHSPFPLTQPTPERILTKITGNTVYLGLGLIAPEDNDRWLRALISIVCFCFGSFCFSAFHRFLPCRRWVLIASFFVQMLFILIAAIMATLGPKVTKSDPLNAWVGVSIALIAFQASGQAVASRALQYSGLTSVVLTSNYCDLFSDPRLFELGLKDNPERNRRTAAPILLLIGAMIGGVWAHSSVGLTGALWTAVGLKAVVVVAWGVWAPETQE